MLITKGANHVIGRLKLSGHHDLRRVETAADFESVNGQWSKEACLSNEVSLQTHELMGELLVWWACGNSRRLVSLKMAWKLCAPCRLSCPVHFFHLNYNSCPSPPSVVSFYAISVQFSSVTQSYPTPWNSMDCSIPGFPVRHQLPEPTQTQVHHIGDAIQPSHPLLFQLLWSTTVWKY